MHKIRVMTVDDHPIFRDGLATLLATHEDMELVVQGANGREAVEAFPRHHPDVTLMDLSMPVMNGVDAIAAIIGEFPGARIIALTTWDGDADIHRALEAGARGYLLKDAVSDEVADAIRTVHAGGRAISGEVAGRRAPWRSLRGPRPDRRRHHTGPGAPAAGLNASCSPLVIRPRFNSPPPRGCRDWLRVPPHLGWRSRNMRWSLLIVTCCVATTAVALDSPSTRTALKPEKIVRDSAAIRPFRVHIADQALQDLRRRIVAARWPTKELIGDRSQGVQLATLRELARYWSTEYDWRKVEAKLNALPQFVTTIDGVDIHFIHVKSRHPGAMPLIMTHGWPGSVIELLETIGPLTDPTSHGGTPGDAFDVVLPSLPGYGFSGEPTQLGWESGRIAAAWGVLMKRLGYTRYVAQGGDVGASVTDFMGRQAPEGLAGIHLSLLAGALGFADRLPAATEQERAAHQALATFRTSGFGYFLEQSTRPQTIGYSLLDSPIGLAAWLLDHDTDSYYKISRAVVNGDPVGRLTRESIVDNITLYWLTGTGASAARWYWEFGQFLARVGNQAPPPIKVPVGFTTFPGEIWAAPRSWVETMYPGLAYFNAVDRGGHFAAWEEPVLFASELRAAFRSLR
jgi:CheY-like chemotaxis protein/pimeloyl-ACP methyl ester carboxylesterase